eukprot:Clim_evm5s236 gene=Clim_evmTU5s236
MKMLKQFILLLVVALVATTMAAPLPERDPSVRSGIDRRATGENTSGISKKKYKKYAEEFGSHKDASAMIEAFEVIQCVYDNLNGTSITDGDDSATNAFLQFIADAVSGEYDDIDACTSEDGQTVSQQIDSLTKDLKSIANPTRKFVTLHLKSMEKFVSQNDVDDVDYIGTLLRNMKHAQKMATTSTTSSDSS